MGAGGMVRHMISARAITARSISTGSSSRLTERSSTAPRFAQKLVGDLVSIIYQTVQSSELLVDFADPTSSPGILSR